MSFGKKCKEFFGKAADAVKDAIESATTPAPQLKPVPVRADNRRGPPRR